MISWRLLWSSQVSVPRLPPHTLDAPSHASQIAKSTLISACFRRSLVIFLTLWHLCFLRLEVKNCALKLEACSAFVLCAPMSAAFFRYVCPEMKVDVGEGNRAADDRQIHQGYTVDTAAEVGRSGPNRAVAVAQQHQVGGAFGAGGSVDRGTTGVNGVVGAGLPIRNGVLLAGVRDGGAAVVAPHQHGGNNGVDGHAFVGSDEYRQVGDFVILLAPLSPRSWRF